MQTTRKFAIAFYYAILLTLFVPFVAESCSIFYRTVHVKGAFRVRVTNHGHPVKGLALVLSHQNPGQFGHDVIASPRTDDDGYVLFPDLKTGPFLVTPDHDAGIITDAVLVNVDSQGVADETIQLHWPARVPLVVQSVEGVMHGPDFYPSQLQSHSLSLLEGISSRVLATTETDGNGRFDFKKTTPPGIYFLQLASSTASEHSDLSLEGLIAIEVNPKAERMGLDLDIGWSTCGLTYAERIKPPELTTSQLCGNVVDAAGAEVSNAQVMLVAHGNESEVIDQTRSGRNGQFAFHEKPEGTYQLLVKFRGFRSFLQVIHLRPNAELGGCQKAIQVRLEVM